jgi:hypothetical protein
MINNTVSELNIRFSILKFLHDEIADPLNLTLFTNDPGTQDDEQRKTELAKYVEVIIDPDESPTEPDCLLDQRVMFQVKSRKQVLEPASEFHDASGFWIREITRKMRHLIQQTTTANNLIALYDFERFTNIDNFWKTGDYSLIQAAITLTHPPVIPGTGFYVVRGTGPQPFKDEEPMRMTWTFIFRHFAPDNMIGQRG